VHPPTEEDADQKARFKYPFASCEVFCCEVDGIFSTLLESTELLDELFSLLDAEAALDCVTAGYFARVVGTLLFRRTIEIMGYLQVGCPWGVKDSGALGESGPSVWGLLLGFPVFWGYWVLGL
jgi:hypothetical protein